MKARGEQECALMSQMEIIIVQTACVEEFVMLATEATKEERKKERKKGEPYSKNCDDETGIGPVGYQVAV